MKPNLVTPADKVSAMLAYRVRSVQATDVIAQIFFLVGKSHRLSCAEAPPASLQVSHLWSAEENKDIVWI